MSSTLGAAARYQGGTVPAQPRASGAPKGRAVSRVEEARRVTYWCQKKKKASLVL